MPIPGILGALFMATQITGALESLYPPLATFYKQFTYKTWPNLTPDIGALIEMRHKQQISGGEYTDKAKEVGISNTFSDAYFNMSKQLLSVADAITLWRRKEITDQEVTDRLHLLRMDDTEIEAAKKVTEFFPSPLDLVRFAVREVYTPDTVTRFGMKEDLPAEFITESAKAGLPEEQASNYWAAHWELPSILQGFRMLHRRIITKDDLSMLLKALDVMPFWREALIKLSYNPLTRVDVRRMHAMGILDDQAVNDAYLDGGYSPENAKHMLDFTKAYNAQGSTTEAKTTVTKAYTEELITIEQFREYLKAFGYFDEVVDYWADMAEYEKTLSVLESSKADLFERYRIGEIELDEVRQELGLQDLPATYINKAIRDEQYKRAKKVKVPSRTELENWLKLDIIDESIYAEKMHAIGYVQQDIERYLTELTLEAEHIKIKYLPIKTYVRWYSSKILTEDDFRRIATLMGITEDDINRLLMEVGEQ